MGPVGQGIVLLGPCVEKGWGHDVFPLPVEMGETEWLFLHAENARPFRQSICHVQLVTVVVRQFGDEHSGFAPNGRTLRHHHDVSASPLTHACISDRGFCATTSIRRRQTRVVPFTYQSYIFWDPAAAWSDVMQTFPHESANSDVGNSEVYFVRFATPHVLTALVELFCEPRPIRTKEGDESPRGDVHSSEPDRASQ